MAINMTAEQYESNLISPVLIPVHSLDSLEQLFRKKTEENNKEYQFITDGMNYSDPASAEGNQFRTHFDSQKVLNFIAQAAGKKVFWYHTHPTIGIDGNQKKHISPPAFTDLRNFAIHASSMYKPPIPRIVEKYGVWEYSADIRTLPRCRDPFDVQMGDHAIFDEICKNKNKPIDEQAKKIIRYYKKINAKVSFRRI